MLVEAAWKYMGTPRPSRSLVARRSAAPPQVAAHAERAERRLHKRFARLGLRMAPTKAVTAVARELAGFVWAVLQPGEERLHPHVTR